MAGMPNQGNLMVVPPAVLEAQLGKQAADNAAAQAEANKPSQDYTSLAGYIRGQYDIFRTHRNTQAGWSERLLQALRTFNGQYDATKIQEIKKFGGSQVYARMIAQKCRSASSLLRDVYLGADRPWALKPPEDPDVPEHIVQQIDQLLQMEMQQHVLMGVPPPSQDQVTDRRLQLMDSARTAAQKRAEEQSEIAEDKIEELIRQGGFYHALAEFIVDLPIFPFACLKGPVVKVTPQLVWPPAGGKPSVVPKPRLTWYRVSPFDIWWTPGVSDIENANVIERQRITRAELNDMLDLPGYNTAEVRAVLQEYGRGGLYDAWDMTDSERAVLENRENPAWNRSGMLNMFEFNGNVLGEMLQEYGMEVEDPQRDYHVQAWMIGAHVIKVQQSPSPRIRHPYFITSFEKVPGTPLGNGLTDILSDIQDVSNATLRALVNNLSISSGPQVVVNTDRLSPDELGEDLYPWKRWNIVSDPTSNSAAQPVSFFQPNSNAQELLAVYKAFSDIADDISAIPKYMQGGAMGGAGRTASGLAMLMGNASKLLQTVSANIDRDVLEPALLQLFDLILLTDSTGLLTGEEKVTVQGVNVAVQRETIRQRQIEFLQATMNPMDAELLGMAGRAAVLRSVASTIGLPGEDLVPNDQKVQQMEAAKKAASANQPIQQAVQKGVIAGVTQGTTSTISEIIKTAVPQQIAVGEQQAMQQTGTPPGPMMQGSAGSAGPAQMGAQGQGMQAPKPPEGPQQTNVVTPAQPRGPAPGQ